jgi:hypothetical protein
MNPNNRISRDNLTQLVDTAIVHGSLKALNCLLRRVPQLTTYLRQNPYKPINLAARYNRANFIPILLSNGASTQLNRPTWENRLEGPLDYAAQNYAEEAFFELIKQTSPYKTSLTYAHELLFQAVLPQRMSSTLRIESEIVRSSRISAIPILKASQPSAIWTTSTYRFIDLFSWMITHTPERFSPNCVAPLVNHFWNSIHYWNQNTQVATDLISYFKTKILNPLIQRGYECTSQKIDSAEARHMVRDQYRTTRPDNPALFIPTYAERIRHLLSRRSMVVPITDPTPPR